MIIRKALESDLPQIIDLLKISLGETLIPKSEALWTWKHVNNPFGKSPVLLAEQDGQLIGVRAFLKWEYLEKGKILQACRAVDTATHPAHQGKGIFKKLTLSLIDEIRPDGVDFIFNTPNTNSTPGYLKMGWEKWGKLPLKLNFHFNKSKRQVPAPVDWNEVSELIRLLESKDSSNSGIETRLVPGYLNWRYRDNPLFPYQFLSDGENYLLVYRIKEGKMGREFRICDLFSLNSLSIASEKEFQRSLDQCIKASGARFSSFSGLNYPKQKLLNMGPLPILNIGPLVTLRKVKEDPIKMSWGWSLGDLEVF